MGRQSSYALQSHRHSWPGNPTMVARSGTKARHQQSRRKLGQPVHRLTANGDRTPGQTRPILSRTSPKVDSTRQSSSNTSSRGHSTSWNGYHRTAISPQVTWPPGGPTPNITSSANGMFLSVTSPYHARFRWTKYREYWFPGFISCTISIPNKLFIWIPYYKIDLILELNCSPVNLLPLKQIRPTHWLAARHAARLPRCP